MMSNAYKLKISSYESYAKIFTRCDVKSRMLTNLWLIHIQSMKKSECFECHKFITKYLRVIIHFKLCSKQTNSFQNEKRTMINDIKRRIISKTRHDSSRTFYLMFEHSKLFIYKTTLSFFRWIRRRLQRKKKNYISRSFKIKRSFAIFASNHTLQWFNFFTFFRFQNFRFFIFFIFNTLILRFYSFFQDFFSAVARTKIVVVSSRSSSLFTTRSINATILASTTTTTFSSASSTKFKKSNKQKSISSISIFAFRCFTNWWSTFLFKNSSLMTQCFWSMSTST